jgi:hypothetical protein
MRGRKRSSAGLSEIGMSRNSASRFASRRRRFRVGSFGAVSACGRHACSWPSRAFATPDCGLCVQLTFDKAVRNLLWRTQLMNRARAASGASRERLKQPAVCDANDCGSRINSEAMLCRVVSYLMNSAPKFVATARRPCSSATGKARRLTQASAAGLALVSVASRTTSKSGPSGDSISITPT